MAKSGEKWLGVASQWFYADKSGFMWLKVVLCGSKYVLPKR